MEIDEVVEIKIIKKRGFWLSAFLILMFIANLFTVYIYFSNPGMIVQAYPKMTLTILYFMGSVAIVNIILVAGIWTWNKWGIYGFYAVAAIVFCINVYIGLSIVGSLAGLVGTVIIFFTTKSKWEYFS